MHRRAAGRRAAFQQGSAWLRLTTRKSRAALPSSQAPRLTQVRKAREPGKASQAPGRTGQRAARSGQSPGTGTHRSQAPGTPSGSHWLSQTSEAGSLRGTGRPGQAATNANATGDEEQETKSRRSGGRSQKPGTRSQEPPATCQDPGGRTAGGRRCGVRRCGGRRCLRPPASEAAKSEVRSAAVPQCSGRSLAHWPVGLALRSGRWAPASQCP